MVIRTPTATSFTFLTPPTLRKHELVPMATDRACLFEHSGFQESRSRRHTGGRDTQVLDDYGGKLKSLSTLSSLVSAWFPVIVVLGSVVFPPTAMPPPIPVPAAPSLPAFPLLWLTFGPPGVPAVPVPPAPACPPEAAMALFAGDRARLRPASLERFLTPCRGAMVREPSDAMPPPKPLPPAPPLPPLPPTAMPPSPPLVG